MCIYIYVMQIGRYLSIYIYIHVCFVYIALYINVTICSRACSSTNSRVAPREDSSILPRLRADLQK